MDLELLAELRTQDGVLRAAAELAGGDPLSSATALRAQGVEPALAAAALTQATLRRAARAKFGPSADRMFFTRAGLEQATRAVVAERRAARLAAAGVRTLADLGCGLGSDALAAARAGIHVYAVDADPLTAEIARVNALSMGLDHLIEVHCADATTVPVERFDAVFADPARRRAGRGRVFDPASFSPPWDFVAGLASRVPRTVLKLAPGIDHVLLPPGAEGEWTSVGGDLVEAAFWCGPLAEVPRRAALCSEHKYATEAPGSGLDTPCSEHKYATGGEGAGGVAYLCSEQRWSELSGPADAVAPVGPVGRYVYDPDPAVVRSHLVAAFAERVGGRLADQDIAYVYADQPAETPFGRLLEITDVLPFSLKRLRALLRDRGIGRLEIRKRGSALEPEQLRRDLKLSGKAGAGLILTRVAGEPTVLITRP